jgi:hypothetical protein
VLPWVHRTAAEAIQHRRIGLGDRDLDEQLALLYAIVEALEHRQAAA